MFADAVNKLLEIHIDQFFKLSRTFREQVVYVLEGGKRLRPAISLDVYNTLCKRNGYPNDVFSSSFLTTEYIHTSSLIIDDLPCMDDAAVRRGKVCLHKRYGEAMAQLTSAVLMSMCMHAYSSDVSRAIDSGDIDKTVASEITVYLIDRLSSVIHVTSQGQFLDTTGVGESSDNPPSKDLGQFLKDVSENTAVEEIIDKKTGTFFEMCFEIAWVLGNRSLDGIENMRDLSHPLSMAFQIIDDIHDMQEDLETDKKNVQGNYALRHGKERAIADAGKYLETFSNAVIDLGLSSEFFDQVLDFLTKSLLKAS